MWLFMWVCLIVTATPAPAHDIYTHWKSPDTGVSCCNRADCYPTESRFTAGSWRALRREDGKWLVVPHNKILTDEQTEDGKAHLCAPPPAVTDIIYCFKKPEAGS
jgi:hypothetical protein